MNNNKINIKTHTHILKTPSTYNWLLNAGAVIPWDSKGAFRKMPINESLQKNNDKAEELMGPA